ncbi:KUP/HAK/KT family potassium transporter [Aurantibacillus circumpalustris]|uniref:KUP/HAK/KT family potassium transporter n=1 Tax=Aurantibacillus circumpalustris TaxID=3036359 RepID=UPI00295B677B|nr:KUP/HAK/KT family potassium transporter [Aurantibacillus circumpalustris]
MSDTQLNRKKISIGGLLISLGIIYGAIGTSPLYVMSAVFRDTVINAEVVKGCLSAIFWTLSIQATVKYIILTLRADNIGEGGIFSLYALVRRTKFKWLLVPAVIGGSALLADGVITPSISISAALEGLRFYNPDVKTVPMVIGILFVLFFLQQFGSGFMWKPFGPYMTLWFLTLGILGVYQLQNNWSVLACLNPYYAFHLLITHPFGFTLFGAIFLCTTGAETIYSDMGHSNKKNIRASWAFVKTMLLLNYFGQGAWLIAQEGRTLQSFRGGNPFYLSMPESFIPYGIAMAVIATIVASQALISGSFTIINEVIRLNLWPKMRIKHPSLLKGQLYIPSINWILMFGCIGVVLYFKESKNMQHAYGLAIALTMLMTTTLLNFYMHMKRYNKYFIYLIITYFLLLELSFFIANMSKFTHGGWITLLIALILIFVMTIWHLAKKIRKRYVEMVRLEDHQQKLIDLSHDNSLTKYATHLVYMTSANNPEEIEAKIIYSILQKRPKRADIYWFLHVDVVDEPYRMEYKVKHVAVDDIIRVDFRLGFRVAPKINLLFRKVVEDLVKNKEVDITSRYQSLNKNNVIGDFKFVVVEKFLSYDNDLPAFEKLVLNIYFIMKHFSMSEAKAFGLDSSSVKIEHFPMVISQPKDLSMRRIN